jgi:hypothetical protein
MCRSLQAQLGRAPVGVNVRLHMAIVRKICLVVSLAVIVLWLAAWLPVELLPQFLHWSLYWMGGILTFLVLPAAVGVWWGIRKPSKSPAPGQAA